MPTLLPRDDDNFAIPALSIKPNAAHSVAFDASSSSTNSTGFAPETRVVSIYTDQPVYINFGDLGVSASASDHFFPAGIYYDVAISNVKSTHYSHVAVRGVSDAGTLYISEKE